jgi:RNA polymerase sigma-70 factor (ECF subfamily)
MGCLYDDGHRVSGSRPVVREPWASCTVTAIGDTDEQLVVAAQQGDRAALEALLRRHYERLYVVCRRITGHDADAADATQEALIALARGLPGFQRTSRFGTWAYRVAVNASLDELRRRRRRPEPGLDGMPPTATTGDDPEGGVDRLDIEVALRQLPVDFRAAVVLRDLCGLDYAEIAEILVIPAGTVRSRIARGRAALVPLLSGNPALLPERPSS